MLKYWRATHRHSVRALISVDSEHAVGSGAVAWGGVLLALFRGCRRRTAPS